MFMRRTSVARTYCLAAWDAAESPELLQRVDIAAMHAARPAPRSQSPSSRSPATALENAYSLLPQAVSLQRKCRATSTASEMPAAACPRHPRLEREEDHGYEQGRGMTGARTVFILATLGVTPS
jgi:hypothetical protein